MEHEIPLRGILVGNGCWGGTATEVNCNGPNSEQNDIDMYYGKGLVSKPLYTEIQSACKWPKTGVNCDLLVEKAFDQVGPHNVYDIYDNCPQTAEWLKQSGKSMRWLLNYLRSKMNTQTSQAEVDRELKALGGGYEWSCGGIMAMGEF